MGQGAKEVLLNTDSILFRYIVVVLFFCIVSSGYAQTTFTENPSKAEFITSDIPGFWEAFDHIEAKRNPFINYLENGSDGLKDFIPNRIESPKKLLKIVKRRYPDYESIRKGSNNIAIYIKQIKKAYKEFKILYHDAVFPPTYFVIGAFNTGGTASDNGLIIGVEKQNPPEQIPLIVAHELIHFNQHYPAGRKSLLAQSIVEGSADFIGEIISGDHLNNETYEYGNNYEKDLMAEFSKIMHGNAYQGWLYGSKGKKKGRPNDLGYWMGYKICAAYYAKAENKKEAINTILNINNFDEFLTKSGYLAGLNN